MCITGHNILCIYITLNVSVVALSVLHITSVYAIYGTNSCKNYVYVCVLVRIMSDALYYVYNTSHVNLV